MSSCPKGMDLDAEDPWPLTPLPSSSWENVLLMQMQLAVCGGLAHDGKEMECAPITQLPAEHFLRCACGIYNN